MCVCMYECISHKTTRVVKSCPPFCIFHVDWCIMCSNWITNIDFSIIHSYKGKELQKSEEKRVLNVRKRLTDVTHDVITMSWAHVIKGVNVSR